MILNLRNAGSDGASVAPIRNRLRVFQCWAVDFRFANSPPGETYTVRVKLMTARRWARRDEANDPRWLALHSGPLVVAIRLHTDTDD